MLHFVDAHEPLCGVHPPPRIDDPPMDLSESRAEAWRM